MSSKAASALHATRQTFTIALGGLRAVARVRWWWRDLVAQARLLAGVTVLPVVVVSLAFGALAALQVGGFARDLAGETGTVAGVVLAAVGRAAPVATALLLAGACGSVMTAAPVSRVLPGKPTADDAVSGSSVADGGVSAEEVHDLVGARLLAAAVVGVLLVCMASLAGAAGAFVVEVVLYDVGAGTYLRAADRLLDVAQAASSLSTGFASGLLAAAIASAAGLRARAGPRGTGDAVHRSGVVTVVLVLVTYLVVALLVSALSPERLLLFHRPLTLWGT